MRQPRLTFQDRLPVFGVVGQLPGDALQHSVPFVKQGLHGKRRRSSPCRLCCERVTCRRSSQLVLLVLMPHRPEEQGKGASSRPSEEKLTEGNEAAVVQMPPPLAAHSRAAERSKRKRDQMWAGKARANQTGGDLNIERAHRRGRRQVLAGELIGRRLRAETLPLRDFHVRCSCQRTPTQRAGPPQTRWAPW